MNKKNEINTLNHKITIIEFNFNRASILTTAIYAFYIPISLDLLSNNQFFQATIFAVIALSITLWPILLNYKLRNLKLQKLKLEK